MTEQETAQYKKRLEDEILQVQALLEGLKESNKPISLDNAIGRVSRMDAINNKSMTENAERMAKLKLVRLQNILANYGTDKFGRCFKCQHPISQARREAVPDAVFCIDCTSKK